MCVMNYSCKGQGWGGGGSGEGSTLVPFPHSQNENRPSMYMCMYIVDLYYVVCVTVV